MKKIAIIAVKDEEWIIEKCLIILDKICDLILISDGESVDGSLEIYKKFSKVKLIKTHKVEIKGLNRRAHLLEAARLIPGENLLFFLDADELPILPETLEFEIFLKNLKRGEVIEVPWLWNWRLA